MEYQLSQSSESADDSIDSKSVVINAPPCSRKRRNSRVDLNDDEYKRRRERNNEAVRKCRIKSREKSKEMADKVNYLREENAVLSQKVQILSKELTLLKELFLTHAKGTSKSVSIVSVIAQQQQQNQAAVVADALVPQASDHVYHRPASSAGSLIKLEEVGSDDEDDSIVDLSIRRPGIVVDRS